MIDETEYEYDRIRGDFHRPAPLRDSGWVRGLMLGIVLGVMMCTGAAYAIYLGELAYESAMRFEDPAPNAEPNTFQPQAMPDAEPRTSGNVFPRPRRAWAQARNPKE